MSLIDGYPEIYQPVKKVDDISANVGGFWHADVTHRERLNLASIEFL